MKQLFAITVVVLVLAGCSSWPTQRETNFKLIFEVGPFGGDGTNVLNTSQGTLTRITNGSPPTTVDVILSQAQLDTIYQSMVEIDFFNYPNELRQAEPDLCVFPWVSYRFFATDGHRVKEVDWIDYSRINSGKAAQLQTLGKMILDMVRRTDGYKKYPHEAGGI